MVLITCVYADGEARGMSGEDVLSITPLLPYVCCFGGHADLRPHARCQLNVTASQSMLSIRQKQWNTQMVER